MLTAYLPSTNCLVPNAAPDDKGLQNAAWIDLLQPTEEEERRVETLLRINVPTRDEMREVESSSAMYHEGDATFVTLRALSRAPGETPRLAAITLVLAANKLITIRYADPTSFRNFISRAIKAGAGDLSGFSALLCFAETLVDRNADLLEETGDNLDKVSAQIFAQNTKAMEKIAADDLGSLLKQIGRSGDIAARVRESLYSVARTLPFLQLEKRDPKTTARMKTLQRDVQSLMDHAGFLTAQIQFLLDSNLGLISIQQNAIMKALSVATIFFLPPTLIAGIYGMNFQHMPELAWIHGYPMAIAAMLLTAIASYVYLHTRKML
ncbi:MAG: magnesium transporter CorA family protein [Acidobacteria bacterium]|nr:magnesium transporter CorA family protein [Acidobacteriota bacterium]